MDQAERWIREQIQEFFEMAKKRGKGLGELSRMITVSAQRLYEIENGYLPYAWEYLGIIAQLNKWVAEENEEKYRAMRMGRKIESEESK